MPAIETATRDGIAEITMTRPKVMNALSHELLDALIVTFGQLTSDDSVRCIVLKGSGSAFMAGGDLNLLLKFGVDARRTCRKVR